MSWKGTTKAFGRLPQHVRVKTGLGTATRDLKFDEILSRFNEMHTRTEKMYKDAIKFRDNISHMLNHQANFSDILIELYNPIVGKKETGSTARRTTTPVKSMKAVEEFQRVMTELRDILIPELNRVDDLVVLPSKDFIDIVKMIKKTITKRDHKKTDFDRFTATVKKLRGKNDRSLSDEKSLHKTEESLAKATEEYEHYNELLKEQLPMFLEYRDQFIEPVVANFYHLQLKIYEILYEKTDQLISDTGYFEAESDIVKHFDERKVKINKQMEEQLTLVKSKKGSKVLKKESDTNDEKTNSKYNKSNGDDDDSDEEIDSPPAYSSIVTTPSVKKSTEFSNPVSSRSTANPKLFPVGKKVPPPLPPHGSKPKLVQYVRALYDYDAQADGDLSFKKGDKIEVVRRTENVDDWWKGKLNGVVGDFPGNYVEKW